MLIKLGALASDVAGSIGGVTFQRSPFGTIGRVLPAGPKRSQPFQSTARQRLANVVRAWQSLTPEDRAAWQAFSESVPWFNRFGDPVAGSGYRAFLRNFAAPFTGAFEGSPFPIVPTPPGSLASILPASPTVLFDAGAETLELHSSDSHSDADTTLAVYGTAPTLASAPRRFSRRVYLTWVKAGESFPFSLTDAYNARYRFRALGSSSFSANFRIAAFNAESGWPGLSVDVQSIT